jgi:hypothetical protein
VGEATAWMAGVRVRWEDLMKNCSARQPIAQRDCSLHLLCLGLAHAPDVLLFSHVAGELWSPVPSSDAACHCHAGHLYPPLRDVRGHAAISVPARALLRAMSLREEHKQPRGLLLLAQGQVFGRVHRPPQLWQMGLLEG